MAQKEGFLVMVLVYQAYGREDVIRQTQFSIISLLTKVSAQSPLQIWVYTDQRALFENYFLCTGQAARNRLRVIEVNGAQIQKWRGAINFVHRVKVEVLLDAARQFTGPLFYVDGDTYFREDPTTLFGQVTDRDSLMHIAENVISEGRDPLSKKIAKFLKKNTFAIGDSDSVNVPPSTVMWNAGALGISETNKALLPKVLQLTDAMHVLYPKHVMEQLAFSHFLQSATRVFAGDRVIGHYWDQKDEYQTVIDDFLAKNSNVVTALSAYRDFRWPAPPVQKEDAPRSWLSRWFS